MCEVTTALAVGAAVVGAAGQKKQAKAEAKASEYNANVAQMNAALAERSARDAIYRGGLEEENLRRQVGQTVAQQRVAYAANGLDVMVGSPLDVMIGTAAMAEIDAQTIRQNAQREADDYRREAGNYEGQSSLLKSQAKSQRAGGNLAAVGTLLGGGANAWGGYQTRQAAAYGG